MPPDYYGGPHDVALEEIEFMLAENGRYCSDVRIHTVNAMAPDSGPWIHQLTVIQPFLGEPPYGREGSRRYKNVQLVEQWIEKDRLIPFLKAMVTKEATVDGERLDLAGSGGLTGEREELPGNNDYSPYPGRLYKTIGRSDRTVFSTPLLSPGLPYYPDLHEAMCQWTGIPLHRGTDSRIGSVLVFMPECRARIVSFAPEDDVLEVTLELAETAVMDLRLVGGWRQAGRWRRFDELVHRTGLKLQVPVPRSAEELNVYLIGGDGRIYDFHVEAENALTFLGQDRVLGSSSSRPLDVQALEEMRLAGEGPTIEFKPLFQKGDAREPELVETIIAFLNAQGGTLLIGINDYGQVVGIARDLVKMFPDQGSDMDGRIELYKGYVKKLCSDKMNRCPTLPMKAVQYGGHRVLVVEVPEGNQKIYQRIEDKAIFIRRGANNYPPDADTEIRQMLGLRDANDVAEPGRGQW